VRQQQLDIHCTVDKGHGRLETRELHASSRLAKDSDWPGLTQAIRIERTTIVGDKQTSEVAYAVTSLSRQRASAADLLAMNRGHWGIENRLHWVRDVTFGEDECRMRTGDGPQNLAALRNAGISLLRFTNVNAIASTLRNYATRPWDLLKKLRSL